MRRKGLSGVRTSQPLEEGLGARPGAVEAALHTFEERGLIKMLESLDDIRDIRLTADGIEAYEDPQSEIAPYVQSITIHAQQMQNTQLGGQGNTINANYSMVLQQLVKEIEASDAPDAKKREWVETLHDIMSNPFTQTVMTVTAMALLPK